MRVEVACLVVAVAACGPGLGHSTPKQIAQDALLDAANDPDDLEHMMRESVLTGGLLFSDPACARDFGAPGKLAPPQFHAFAACLAGLHLQAGERSDTLPDVSIVSYPPGVELQVRLVHEWEGQRILWIGFAGRHDPADTRPTMTPHLLESLREGGTLHPAIDGTLGPGAYAWLRFCIDAAGNPTSVTPIEATSKKASRIMEAAAGAWKLRPSPIGAACATVAVGDPKPDLRLPLAPAPDHTVRIPITAFHRKTGDANIVPDDGTKTEMSRAKPRSRWVGTYNMCIDGTGSVTRVDLLRSTGNAAYDRKIGETIKQTWSFEPLDGGEPACSAVTFIYSQG